MDFQTIFNTIILPLLVILTPLGAAYIARRFVVTDKDRLRLVEIDKIAEGALNIIRINNPSKGWLNDIDDIKDRLVEEILAAGTTTSVEVAERAASTAIANVLP